MELFLSDSKVSNVFVGKKMLLCINIYGREIQRNENNLQIFDASFYY